MSDYNVIGLSGEADSSANIDLSIPLPGSHSGRRIVEIVDVDEKGWSSLARDAGTPWKDALGVFKGDKGFEIVDPSEFLDHYLKLLPQSVATPDPGDLVDKENLPSFDEVIADAVEDSIKDVKDGRIKIPMKNGVVVRRKQRL